MISYWVMRLFILYIYNVAAKLQKRNHITVTIVKKNKSGMKKAVVAAVWRVMSGGVVNKKNEEKSFEGFAF